MNLRPVGIWQAMASVSVCVCVLTVAFAIISWVQQIFRSIMIYASDTLITIIINLMRRIGIEQTNKNAIDWRNKKKKNQCLWVRELDDICAQFDSCLLASSSLEKSPSAQQQIKSIKSVAWARFWIEFDWYFVCVSSPKRSNLTENEQKKKKQGHLARIWHTSLRTNNFAAISLGATPTVFASKNNWFVCVCSMADVVCCQKDCWLNIISKMKIYADNKQRARSSPQDDRIWFGWSVSPLKWLVFTWFGFFFSWSN